MPSKIVSTGILFIFLVGCASTIGTKTETPSELMLQYRLPPGQQLAYDLSSKTKEVSEVMGQSIEVTTISSSRFTLLPKGMEGINNSVQVTFDSSSLTINHPRGELKADMAGVIGKSFAMQLSPSGKEMDFKGNEEIQYTLGPVGKRNATTAFKTIFTDLSEKPVKIGDTWNTKDSIQEGGSGMNIIIVMDGLSRLDGLTSRDGYDCARIVTMFTGTIQGEGTQGPMQISTKGTFEGVDTTFFAHEKGLLLHSISSNTMKTTTEASGPQNMTIPGTRTSQIVLTLTGSKNTK